MDIDRIVLPTPTKGWRRSSAAAFSCRAQRHSLETSYLRILGHPTGRILLHRDPFPFDFDRVVTEAARRGVAMEINASPERLDLDGALIRTAKAKGAKFTVSTDAHHPKQLANMRYGVVTARRGWLGPDDILNTLDAGEFARVMKSRL